MNVCLPAFAPPKMSMSIFLIFSGFIDFLWKCKFTLEESFLVIKVCLSDNVLSYSVTDSIAVKLSIACGTSGSCKSYGTDGLSSESKEVSGLVVVVNSR